MQKFTRRDLLSIALCIVLTTIFLAIGIRYFDAAFPEASVDFRVDRSESERLAARLLTSSGANLAPLRHSAEFTRDDDAKIFLERKLGLKAANALMRKEVKVWSWRHRWFKPLQREEYAVEIAPSGDLVAFDHIVADELRAPAITAPQAKPIADAFLLHNGILPSTLRFLGTSERRLPKRVELTLNYESLNTHPAGAPYRFTVVLRGSAVSSFRQQLRVPEQWTREYAELRSKNFAASDIDTIFLLGTIIAALIVFIVRLRGRNVDIRFAVTIGLIAFALVLLTSLNSIPSALASYDTNTSYGNFLGKQILSAVLGGFVSGVALMVIAGAGEALYRQRYPHQLAIPRLMNRRALRSRRVFLGFIIGLTLFSGFLAYQVVFYLIASHFGAWSPAEVPYDEILSTKFPWLAVLFMGFFPAVSEEFLSRAFSIPFLERLLRSRVAAIVLSGFIWGFGHATYPNQPFFIRGVEVGIAGVIIGTLMQRFGLLPLLVWHYTVDALYTAFILMRSGNTYYIVTSAAASLLFLVPVVISALLYFRHGGFEPDDDLENRASPIALPQPSVPATTISAAPVMESPQLRSSFPWLIALLLLAAGLAALSMRKSGMRDAINYRTTKEQATAIAAKHLAHIGARGVPSKVVAAPASGFRRWVAPPPNQTSVGEEDGGDPAGYDTVAAEYILRHAPLSRLLQIERDKVQAATWGVRFFEPMKREEYRVEVDSRLGTPLGFHHIVQEASAGARLEQPEAEQLARRSFHFYGLNPADFETREALRFEQPARRDWLFHFQEKRPLVAAAFQRVNVRLAGDAVTQFTRTVQIPEEEVRRATEQTAMNTILVVLKIIGSLGLVALVIQGILGASHQRPFAWRLGLRGALYAAPLGLVAMLTQLQQNLYDYSTAVGWSTFLVVATVKSFLLLAGSLSVVFVATAVIATAYPEAQALLSARVRAIFRADALARVAAAAGTALLLGSLTSLLASKFHGHWPLRAFEPPDLVATTFPFLNAVWSIALEVLVLAAFASALRAVTWKHVPLLATVSMFLFTLNPGVTSDQLAGSLLSAATTAIFFYLIGYQLAARNPLALITTATLLATAVELGDFLRNDRADLRIQAALAALAVLLFLIWLFQPAKRDDSAGIAVET